MPNFTERTKQSFEKSCEAVFNSLKPGEDAVLSLNAEDSLFVRFNNNKVRQNTSVEQISLSLQLQTQNRTTNIAFSLTGNVEEDIRRSQHWLNEARQECAQLPQDPYQVTLANNGQSEVQFSGKILPLQEVIGAVVEPAQGSDLAGLYCAGPVISANKNSKGQSHWFSTESFFMDYSLYNGEKAVKSVYAGTEWQQNEFVQNLSHSKNQLALMGTGEKNRTSRRIQNLSGARCRFGNSRPSGLGLSGLWRLQTR